MPHSMTAFSRQTHEANWGSLQLELRSVNQRYLEPHFRLPDALRDLEPHFREAMRQRLARGKVECSLRFDPAEGNAAPGINADQLAALSQALEQVRKRARSESNAADLLAPAADAATVHALRVVGSQPEHGGAVEQLDAFSLRAACRLESHLSSRAPARRVRRPPRSRPRF